MKLPRVVAVPAALAVFGFFATLTAGLVVVYATEDFLHKILKNRHT